MLLVAALVTALYAFRGRIFASLFEPHEPPATQQGVSLREVRDGDVTVIAEDLEIPWEIAFLPDGDLLVTERPGTVVRIGERPRHYRIAGVRHAGEGGLMGLALHPRFAETHWVYLYYTTSGAAGLENAVVRYRLTEDALTDPASILSGIPAARFHDGGRIAFGPDGYLYVTTGDATESGRAQDLTSLAGKILRLTETGRIPTDNPFGTAVYSYGHRNPQGLAWDARGRLWSTEHGRSGFSSGFDELNLIEPRKNYGWPLIEGDDTAGGTVPPLLHSGPDYTWAPAGAAFWDGSMFFGGLRGEALYEARIRDAPVELRAHFHREFGRIRAVRLGPDGMLYFTTSNRDGRGRVRPGDDKIVRVNPSVLKAMEGDGRR